MLSAEIADDQDHHAIQLLRELADDVACKVILSTIDSAKTVQQIWIENKIPQSSTYRKIRRLQSMGLLFVEKIIIDDDGRKSLCYRSKIKSLEFNLKKGGILLQFDKNDTIIRTSQPYPILRC